MKSRSTLTLAAALVTLMALAGCKKPNEPSSPDNPDPKAAQQGQPQDQGPGTTTNFENPPAEPAKPAE